MIGILISLSMTHKGIETGLKKTRDETARVKAADIAYIALPYRLDNPIFSNIVIHAPIATKLSKSHKSDKSGLSFS